MKCIGWAVQMLAKVGRTTVGVGLLLMGMGSVAFAFDGIPEIDVGSAASAIALLTGGVMLFRDWLRTK